MRGTRPTRRLCSTDRAFARSAPFQPVRSTTSGDGVGWGGRGELVVSWHSITTCWFRLMCHVCTNNVPCIQTTAKRAQRGQHAESNAREMVYGSFWKRSPERQHVLTCLVQLGRKQRHCRSLNAGWCKRRQFRAYCTERCHLWGGNHRWTTSIYLHLVCVVDVLVRL